MPTIGEPFVPYTGSGMTGPSYPINPGGRTTEPIPVFAEIIPRKKRPPQRTPLQAHKDLELGYVDDWDSTRPFEGPINTGLTPADRYQLGKPPRPIFGKRWFKFHYEIFFPE